MLLLLSLPTSSSFKEWCLLVTSSPQEELRNLPLAFSATSCIQSLSKFPWCYLSMPTAVTLIPGTYISHLPFNSLWLFSILQIAAREYFLILASFFLIWKAQRRGEWETDLASAGSLPKGSHTSESWDRPKPGAGNSIWGAHIGGSDPVAWSISESSQHARQQEVAFGSRTGTWAQALWNRIWRS